MKELFEIQSGIVCPKATPGPGGKFLYRTTNDILAAVRPLLKKHTCVLHVNCEVVEHANFPYVKATVTLENSAGESVTATYEAREENGMIRGSQGTGSAATYATKGALNALFLMDDDATDPDSVDDRAAAPANQKAKATAATVHEPAQKAVFDRQYLTKAAQWCVDNVMTAAELLRWYIYQPDDLTALDAEIKRIINM